MFSVHIDNQPIMTLPASFTKKEAFKFMLHNDMMDSFPNQKVRTLKDESGKVVHEFIRVTESPFPHLIKWKNK
jgi:hypothetical protein